MALLFAEAAEKYAAKMNCENDNQLSNKVSDLFDMLDNPDGIKEDNRYSGMLPQKVFMTFVANEYYQKSIEDINNTTIGNKAVRKKNFQQIMKESFFYGANRFGNNFIA